MSIDGCSPPPPRSPHLRTIFIDSNIDTHFAISVSFHHTIRNVKAIIRAEHVLCFPELGEISIQAIKVKRRGFFYILADSMYVSNAFDGIKGSWYLCIDVVSMCPLKDHEVVANKIINAHDVSISPSVERKNSYPNVRGHHFTMSTEINNEHRPERFIVQEKNKKRRKKTRNNLHEQLLGDHRRGEKFSKIHKIDESKKSPDTVKDQEVVANKITNAHDVAISPSEERTNSCPDGRGHHFTMSTEINNEHGQEMLIVQEKDKKRRKKRRKKSCPDGRGYHDTMSTEINNEHRQEMLMVQEKNKRRRKKMRNVLGKHLLGNHRSRGKFSKIHKIDGAKKSPEISCGGKEFLATSLEGVHSKLTHKDAEVLQKPWIFEKQTKKRRRKSSKSHEESHLAMPSKTLLTQESTLPRGSGKEAGDSFFLGNIDEALPSDCRDVRATTDNVSLFDVANPKEKDTLSLETYTVIVPSTNKEPVEDQILQVNPDDRRQKNVNSALGTNSNELMRQPNQISELRKANCQEYMSSTQLDPKVSCKLRRRKKKLKEESSRVLQSAEVNVNQVRLNSDSSEVSLNDVQNVFVAAKSIKQADQKADGGNCIGTVSEISSTSKKVSNDTVSVMNSDNPPNNISSNFSGISNLFVDHDIATVSPSLPASEDQVKTRRRRKSSKSGRSGLECPDISAASLPKSNGELTESNEGRGSDPSNHAYVSNQNIEQPLVVARTSVPLFEEDSPEPVKNPLMKSLGPCEEALDGPEHIKKGNATTHTLSEGAWEGPTMSKSVRKKSKKKVLNVQSSSKISGHTEIHRNGYTSLNFNNYFIPEQFRPQKNDTASNGSRTANVRINKKTKHLSDQDSSLGVIEVDSSLQKADENHNIEKKLPNYVSQTLVQPSGDMETEQGEKIIDSMASDDQCTRYNGGDPSTRSNLVVDAVGLNNFVFSQSLGATNDVLSSESIEDTPQHLRRFRVVRKIPIRRKKRMSNISNPEILAYENHNTGKKLQNYVSQILVQPSRDMETEHGEKVIDTRASYDQCAQYNVGDPSTRSNLVDDAVGLNNVDFSQRQGATNHVSSSESTEDRPQHLRRFRVVRKIPIRRKSRMLNISNPEILADENHNNEKRLQNYVSQTLVQPSGGMETEQGEKIIDTMASYDQCARCNGGDPSTRSNLVGDAVGLNNFDFSRSQGATAHVSSSESTEDTPQHLKRFRVVRKIPIRRKKRMPNISNPEILLLDASSRNHGDTSGTFPDSHLGEMQQKSVPSQAWKIRVLNQMNSVKFAEMTGQRS